MSALLYLPGILVVLFRRRGLFFTLASVVGLVLAQVALGWQFLRGNSQSYLKLAFEFSRQFLYKWTVNWRFVSEETFLSTTWSRSLLALHLGTLVAFGFIWCRRDGGVFAVISRGIRKPASSPSFVPLSADCECDSHTRIYRQFDGRLLDVATILFTSNLVGIAFARSLHYQFYSWYAYHLPFLMWRTKYPVPIK